jgi:hypothetical protein
LRAARANRGFYADQKRIRIETTVIDKNKGGTGISYKIVDCVRMAFIRTQSTIRADGFSSAPNRNSATTISAS